MAKILFFSSTDTLPHYLGSSGNIQGLNAKHKVDASTLKFSPSIATRSTKQKGLMGCVVPIAALASAINSMKRCWKHCHQLISTEGVNITVHMATVWRKILKNAGESVKSILALIFSLQSSQDFTPGLCVDLKQISSSWQLKAGPWSAAKHIPLRPR